jgi:hypothetical protein
MRISRRIIGFGLLVLLSASSTVLKAEVSPLLQEIAEHWIKDGQQWGFTQKVRETGRDGVTRERLENFDLSRGYERRWQLLKIDGREPTVAEVQEWSQRKNRGKKKNLKSWFEYVDLENARVTGHSDRTVDYEVPLKRLAGGLFPGDKVLVYLTIDKEARAIEHAEVRIFEPFNVALGLAEVVEVDAHVNIPTEPKAGSLASNAPREDPSGQVSATVNRIGGKRIEYTWTEFRRTPRS